MTADRHRK